MKSIAVSDGVINWLEVSDIHLGNLRTPTEFILDNLEAAFFDSGILTNMHLVIIAGDLFDRLLEYNHPASGRILLFIDRLMNECSYLKIKLRVLEGTPSHDNKQNKVFDDLYATGKYSCDMRYVDTLSIEYIPEWDFRILYVPDKIRTTVDLVWRDTQALLESHGLKQVDMAIMHCAFSHQLPGMVKEVFQPEDWLKIVKHWILVGHVHLHSIYDRIGVAGSFDRIAQGEEKPKGFLVGTMNLKDPRKNEIYFIENKRAKKYVTIELKPELTIEDCLLKIESIVEKLPSESYVQIRAGKGHPIFANMADVSKINLSNHWSKDEKLLEEEEDSSQEEIDETLETWVPIHLDKDNILPIVSERLMNKGLTGKLYDKACLFLKEAK